MVGGHRKVKGGTCGDTAAQQEHLVERGLGIDFRQIRLIHDGVLGEGRGVEEVVDRLSVFGESTLLARVDVPPGHGQSVRAEIAGLDMTEGTLRALGLVQRDDVIALGEL